jgi:hypothetical protein
MKKFKGVFLVLSILCTLVFIGWITARGVSGLQFNLNCEAYLKRAADANTIEMAKEELAKAIKYAEDNKLTDGIVSIFLKNPANDIGFWYKNITSAYEELKELPDDSTPLEKTNVLMKLRESLTDRDEGGGTKVILPEGIEIYPNNVMFFWWGLLSGLATFTFWMLFCFSFGVKVKVE